VTGDHFPPGKKEKRKRVFLIQGPKSKKKRGHKKNLEKKDEEKREEGRRVSGELGRFPKNQRRKKTLKKLCNWSPKREDRGAARGERRCRFGFKRDERVVLRKKAHLVRGDY